jgi:hypothetical protein
MKDSDFVTVQVVHGEFEANVIKGRLESEGIPAFLQYESVGRVYTVMIDGLGEIKIKVPAQFAEEAKQILQQTTDDPESHND